MKASNLLCQMRHLQQIDLSYNTQVSPQAIRKLRAGLPRTEIWSWGVDDGTRR